MKSSNSIIDKITNWEAWPFKLLYTPISIFWLWYTIRSGSLWFFTSSNPKLTFGGMEGEPKKEMYDLLPTDLYPATFNVLPGEDFSVLQQNLVDYKISYPFIVKPEIGGQGILLRKIDDEAALRHYHTMMPWEYIVQALVYYPMEVSVFYIRHPQQNKGMVTGFLHKIPLQVTGNGRETLSALIGQHPKGGKRMEELFSKHKERWNEVLPAGEKYMLSYAANHNRGAQFVDLKEKIDDQLVSIFDNISLKINDFFYGRYDIMCSQVEDLKMGKNFTILEFNGCGAEPNHFYDTGYTLIGAYKEILKHWKALFQISKYNKQQGVKPWPFQKGSEFVRSARAHIRDMKKVDADMG
ncbi:MAG: hypothetical protein ABIQ31_27005 [Ferruginibacter sp.]